jgi:hypothetical protein
MDTSKSPTISSFIPTALILIIVGAGGLFWLFYSIPPTVGPRWLFFFLLVLVITGFFIPVTAFLNLRFPSTPAVAPRVIIRQASWFGIYGATLAWLRMGRVLSTALALLLAVGFFLIEFLLRLNERSQWKPE